MMDDNKEEKGKLDFMESLRREAAEERLKSKNSESEKIFSNDADDDNNHKEEDKFDYYYSAEENSSSSKRILIGIFGVGAIGLMGYLGFGYFQDDKNLTQNSAIVATDKVKEVDSTTAPKEQKGEEVAIAPVKNAIKEESKTKETHSEANTNTETTDEEKKMVATIIKSINQKKESIDENIKVDTPVKIAKKEIVVEKEKPKKVEKEIVKKRVITKKEKPKKIVTKRVTVKKETPKKVQQRIVIVKKGDTLGSISEKFYGNPMAFKRIVKANRDIRSASSSLRLGQKIIVPRIGKEKKRRFVTVKKGDTLARIAKRFYGDSSKFQKIIDANYRIKSASSRLSIGQKIYVPR